jgi:hypothetical protein
VEKRKIRMQTLYKTVNEGSGVKKLNRVISKFWEKDL